jgi:hypothetical protein
LLEVVKGEEMEHRVVTVVGGVVIIVRGEGGGPVGRCGHWGVVSGEGVVVIGGGQVVVIIG